MGSVCSLGVLSPTQAAVGDSPQLPVVTEGASSWGGAGRDQGLHPALWGGWPHVPRRASAVVLRTAGPTRQGQPQAARRARGGVGRASCLPAAPCKGGHGGAAVAPFSGAAPRAAQPGLRVPRLAGRQALLSPEATCLCHAGWGDCHWLGPTAVTVGLRVPHGRAEPCPLRGRGRVGAPSQTRVLPGSPGLPPGGQGGSRPVEAEGPGIWLVWASPAVSVARRPERAALDTERLLRLESLWPPPPGPLPGGLRTHRGPGPTVCGGRGVSSTRRPLGGSWGSWVRPTCLCETRGGRPSFQLLGVAQSPRLGGRPLRGPGLLGLGGCPGHRPSQVLVLGKGLPPGRRSDSSTISGPVGSWEAGGTIWEGKKEKQRERDTGVWPQSWMSPASPASPRPSPEPMSALPTAAAPEAPSKDTGELAGEERGRPPCLPGAAPTLGRAPLSRAPGGRTHSSRKPSLRGDSRDLQR